MVEIFINTNKEISYPSGHAVYVTVDKTWDPLSKAFKKHTYTIQYSGRGYVPSNYNITVNVPSKKFAFEYQRPTNKVLKVEVYFKASDDVSREVPLILGFICQDNSKWYYTYNHLKSNSPKAQFLSGDGKIDEKDLVTRLLEEIGDSISRPQKLVIRLDEKPHGVGDIKYPESGHYKEEKRITVKKVDLKGLTEFDGYDKYEHTVASSVTAEDFYVSYKNNSRYFESDSTSRGLYLLGKVTAYFETKSPKQLVLFTLSFRGKATYEYKYSDFANDFKTLTFSQSKTVTKLNPLSTGHGGVYSDSDLKTTLPKESKKLEQLITFVEGGDVNENISTKKVEIRGERGIKFKKFIMRPNTSDKGGVRSAGPWNVVNSQLFTLEPKLKIPEELLGSIVTSGNSNKYESISVFYTSDEKALLVEFDKGGRKKEYFKRKDKDGEIWEIADSDGINTGSDKPLVEKLTEIGIGAGVIEGSSVVGPAVGSVTAILVAGGGAGFAIYKYPQFFLSLIRR